MTNERELKGGPKHYFKSLLETCPYKLVRIRHATGEPNPSGLPTHDSPVFDYLKSSFIPVYLNEIEFTI
jgi:hypothetical protein